MLFRLFRACLSCTPISSWAPRTLVPCPLLLFQQPDSPRTASRHDLLRLLCQDHLLCLLAAHPGHQPPLVSHWRGSWEVICGASLLEPLPKPSSRLAPGTSAGQTMHAWPGHWLASRPPVQLAGCKAFVLLCFLSSGAENVRAEWFWKKPSPAPRCSDGTTKVQRRLEPGVALGLPGPAGVVLTCPGVLLFGGSVGVDHRDVGCRKTRTF